MVVAIAIAVLGPLLWAVDLTILLASGTDPVVAEGPGVSTLEQWKGIMPLVAPWWVYLALAVTVWVLLVVTWAPDRRLPMTYRKGILLMMGPGVLAFWSFMSAAVSLSSGAWFEPEGFGLYWIPAGIAAAAALVALVRWFTTRAARTTPSRRRPRARTS